MNSAPCITFEGFVVTWMTVTKKWAPISCQNGHWE